MLETLLNHLRSYGMSDLNFIIVNSKLSHSQEKVHELTKRVSFEVFQETDEEEVWSLMEGGKDDMYVYDRCGRLTYYIPFPLSILTESPLVSNAILATYFRNPCGDNCDQNKTIEIDEFVKNMERDFESSNETEKDNATYVPAEDSLFNNETNNETYTSNDLLNVIDPMNDEIDISNSTDIVNITDYDYPTHNSTSYVNETNSTSVGKAKSIFNSIYKLFFNNGNNNDKTFEDSDATVNETLNNAATITSNDTHKQTKINTHPHHHMDHHLHHKKEHKDRSDSRGKMKSDRCLEADYEVCKSWSKKRLLHAQKCCSGTHSDAEIQDHRSCTHFGKKRCKKIQSILKCCIKTVYTEPTATVPSSEPSTVASKEDSIAVTITQSTETNQVPDVTCCKTTDDGKVCRVSSSGICEEGEYVERTPQKGK